MATIVGIERTDPSRLTTPHLPMGMFLQDPSMPRLRADYPVDLAGDFLSGTGSSRLVVRDADERDLPLFPGLDWARERDLSFARFDADGDAVDNVQFHQVNVFAVAAHTLDMVEQELGHRIAWRTGGPLVIRPHAFAGANAYYTPAAPSLNFGYFSSPFRRAPIWMCLSHDVIAHELGHAVLDALRPGFANASHLDTNALHESFGDIFAMFSALEHEAVVAHLYRQSGGDMRHESLVSRLGEEFGVGMSGVGAPYLRSALYGPRYEDAPKESHARSSVWTAALYDILERLVARTAPVGSDLGAFSAALAEAVRWVKGMLFRALHYTPPCDITMPMLARLIDEADTRVYPQDAEFRNIAHEVFMARGLWDPALDFRAPDIGQAVREAAEAGPAALALAVFRHAEALRIPLAPDIRVLQPRIVTTTREVDTVQQGAAKVTRRITEHYLEYGYEHIELVQDWASGEWVAVAVYGGGTLVMDEQWQAGLLAAYPEARHGDGGGSRGAIEAWASARAAFQALHKDGIQPALAARDADGPTHRGAGPCAFELRRSPAGAYRLVRPPCTMRDHLAGVGRATRGTRWA